MSVNNLKIIKKLILVQEDQQEPINKCLTIIENLEAPESSPAVIIAFDYFSKDKRSYMPTRGRYGEMQEQYGVPSSALEIIKNIVVKKSLKAVYLYPLFPNDVREKDENSGYRRSQLEKSKESLNNLIKRLKQIHGSSFSGVCFSGFYNNMQAPDYFNSFNSMNFGRMGIYEEDTPCIYTLPLTILASDRKGESSEDYASLLGYFTQHLDTLLEGKDKYTVDLEGWTCNLVKTIEDFNLMLQEIKESPVTSWDTETTGLSRTQEKILTIQIATNSKKAYVLPFEHRDSPFTVSEINYIKKQFKDYFERGTSKFQIYQNAKYDLSQFLHHFNLKYINHSIYDIQAGEFSLNENRKFLMLFYPRPYSLEFISQNYGGRDIFKRGKLGKENRTTLENEKLEDIAEYGIKDVILPFQIAAFQIKEAKRRGDKKFLKTVTRLVSDMIYCFTIMESNGTLVDKRYLLELRDAKSLINQRLRETEESFRNFDSVKIANDILLEKAGYSSKPSIFNLKKNLFNINEQLSQQTLFFDVLKLKPLSDRKDGGGSIGKEFKEHYKKTVPEVDTLDKHDKIKKVKSTFLDAHYERFSTDKDLRSDSRMRASYNFTGVVTGRASASNPNLQQIPSRGEYSKIVKRQFIASPNHLLMKADYSAHEVRNWGNISFDELICASFDFGKQLRKQLRYYFSNDLESWSQLRNFQDETKWIAKEDALNYEQKLELISTILDKKFKKICQLVFDLENKGDVHKLNYEFFFGIPAYLVNKQQRQSVKNVVFGVMYGKAAMSLAQDVGCTEQEAQELMDKLFEKFSKGGTWIRNCQKLGRELFEIYSPLGRIRHLHAYMHPSFSIKSSMDRKGPNSCIQGMSSDIGFMAGKIMQDLCWNWFWKNNIGFDFKYMNVVHDSTETEGRISHLPIISYMIEHSYTTLTHRCCRDVYNFNLTCGFEVEQELGPSFAHCEVYDNFCQFETLIKEAIQWGEENIKSYNVDPEELEKCLYNYEIINNIRRQELKKSAGNLVDYDMDINEQNILNLGLKL